MSRTLGDEGRGGGGKKNKWAVCYNNITCILIVRQNFKFHLAFSIPLNFAKVIVNSFKGHKLGKLYRLLRVYVEEKPD